MRGKFEGVFRDLAEDIAPILSDYRNNLDRIAVTQKPDATLLSEADLAVQSAIIAQIRAFDPQATIIAEENEPVARTVEKRVWIVDPIDGTKQFLDLSAREFCSVVCVVEDRLPVACLIIAPILGLSGGPIIVSADLERGEILVNGIVAQAPPAASRAPRHLSVTHDAKRQRPLFADQAEALGFSLKTRTTSQTLDLVRLSADLRDHAGSEMYCFDVFYRDNQLIWDGAAGHLLAQIRGYKTVDRHGTPLLPYSGAFLSGPQPRLETVICGPPANVEWILALMQVENP
jgi:3'(2'), 5'-bisphosphate nucleotidase